MTCTYLAETFDTFKAERRPFTGHPWSGRSAMSYGRKIPTD